MQKKNIVYLCLQREKSPYIRQHQTYKVLHILAAPTFDLNYDSHQTISAVCLIIFQSSEQDQSSSNPWPRQHFIG